MMFKKLIKTYFISSSILAHCLIIVIAAYFVTDKINNYWRWPIIKRWVLGDVDKSDVYRFGVDGFKSLPRGRWIKIHQQHSDDVVHFSRQAHAGSGFDSLRSRILIFGSDTHGENWNNAVYTFDLNTLTWMQSYPLDSPASYTVNTKGFPVAGIRHNHPWAMHTFGALAYDEIHDNLLVASYPEHLSPSRYGQNLAFLWKQIKQHPTWLYDSKSNSWRVYEGKSEHFFPYAIAYDSDRGVVTGFRPYGIFDWKGEIVGWERVGEKSYGQYHTNVVYDSVNHVFIFYGGNKLQNAVFMYKAGNKTTEKMPTIGRRPPPGQSVPLAFHKKIGKVVALVDADDEAQTWLYDYAQDQWQRLEGGDFPYKVGMNYTMEYDVRHNIVVLVSSPQNEATAVWALRL